MHYLKCNSCGHLNKIESETLLFCSKCNKKLENNFRDWHIRNSDKSFEDFKKLVCINELEIPTEKSGNKWTNPKSLKYWIGFVVAFAVFYAVGQIGGEKLVSLFKSEKTSHEVLSQNWIREKYGNFGLIVETPVIMTEVELTLPDFVKEIIDETSAFQYFSAKGFKVFIQSIKYKIIIAEKNLQDGANGSVNEMKMQKGVTNFDYKEEKIVLNAIPGIKQIGSFKQNGIQIEFINTMYGEGYNMWQVTVAYQSDDEVGKIAAKKVIESVEIESF
jgi:hypothetical protein